MARAVTQEQSMGCGVACVASVIGESYKEALKLFADKNAAVTRGYWCFEVRDALKRAGERYEHRRAKPSDKVLLRQEGVIVFIKRCKKYPCGHYLLKTKKGWMNPWINHPDITPAKSGFEKRLPGTAEWILFPKQERAFSKEKKKRRS